MREIENTRLSIYQFWDENPLISPWMRPFLPANRMFSDFILGILGLLISGGIILLFVIYITDNNLFVIASLGLVGAYFPGGWWSRWFKASMRFQVAKRREGKSDV
jgi:hypothetical protein